MNFRSWAVGVRAGIYLSKFIFHGVVKRTCRNEEIGNINHFEDDKRRKQEYKLLY